MSSEEIYMHKNFWEKPIKAIQIKDGDGNTITFIPHPLFDEPFCKQVKDKKNDKTIRPTEQ